MGNRLFADLPGGDLAAVPANGNAGHVHDEQLTQRDLS